jgi:hypothetical protein|tara:strand:- start:2169 stop:3179 length:1011 start_codon:yes stop_codon:yes gene_type:complete
MRYLFDHSECGGIVLFAPEGYCSIYDVRQYVVGDRRALGERLDFILKKSATIDEMSEAVLDFRASRAKVFSFEEVVEHTFHEALLKSQVYACHPNHGTWGFGFPIFWSTVRYIHIARMPEASAYFDNALDWPGHVAEIQKSVEAGEDPWAATFLSMPPASPSFFFNRDTYLVDLTDFRKLEEFNPYVFMPRAHGYSFDVADIAPFEGWALCMEGKVEDYSAWRDNFERACAHTLLVAAWGEDIMEGMELAPLSELADQTQQLPDRVIENGRRTVREEAEFRKFARTYIDEQGSQTTKAELKKAYKGSIGSRAFERTWQELTQDYPDLSKPGRRRKS